MSKVIVNEINYNEVLDNDNTISIYDSLIINSQKDDNINNHNLTTYSVVNGEVVTRDVMNLLINEKSVDRFHSELSQALKLTNSHKVKQFTEESMGVKCPEKPEKMSKDEVKFIIKMVMSEMTELAQTVSDSPVDAIDLVKDCLGCDVNYNYIKPENDDMEIIAQQNDSFVDAWYYMLNAACKKGVNLSRIFDSVHESNMNKKNKDGTFHRRPDGKVIKPDDWKPADIKKEIINHYNNECW